MQNVRTIAFTEEDLNIYMDEFEYKHSGLYCSFKYCGYIIVEIFNSLEMKKTDIVKQLDLTEFLEIVHPSFNINFDNSIALYDNAINYKSNIGAIVLKDINYKIGK